MLNIEKEIKILESDLYKIKQKLPYKDYIILSRQTNLSLEESTSTSQSEFSAAAPRARELCNQTCAVFSTSCTFCLICSDIVR